MTWLLPGKEVLDALKVKGVEVSSTEEFIADKRKRWWHGPKGALWKLKKKKERNAYHRSYYAQNREKRRAYLNEKQREYRA